MVTLKSSHFRQNNEGATHEWPGRKSVEATANEEAGELARLGLVVG